ncbi:sigma factor-like helix-turn-helix DNA-binding protein, partial [Streptomyces massasporeus]
NGRRGDGGSDPADRIALDESVDMAFLVVLESMTPAERVAFILHDVFRYPFTELATIVGRTPAACRQLASSARRRVRAAREPEPPTGLQARVIRDFKQAWEAQDIAALVGLLNPDATVVVDGGGLVGAALRPITGAGEIARYIVAIGDMAPGMTLEVRSVNGRPGLVARRGGTTVTVAAFGLADGRITHIWAVRNPETARRQAPVQTPRTLLLTMPHTSCGAAGLPLESRGEPLRYAARRQDSPAHRLTHVPTRPHLSHRSHRGLDHAGRAESIGKDSTKWSGRCRRAARKQHKGT